MRETFETPRKCAGIRFFSCVYPQMRTKIKVQAKPFTANFAAIKLLSLVKKRLNGLNCAFVACCCQGSSFRIPVLCKQTVYHRVFARVCAKQQQIRKFCRNYILCNYSFLLHFSHGSVFCGGKRIRRLHCRDICGLASWSVWLS